MKRIVAVLLYKYLWTFLKIRTYVDRYALFCNKQNNWTPFDLLLDISICIRVYFVGVRDNRGDLVIVSYSLSRSPIIRHLTYFSFASLRTIWSRPHLSTPFTSPGSRVFLTPVQFETYVKLQNIIKISKSK